MEQAASFDLPSAPPEGDRATGASFVSVDLVSPTNFQDLAAFNDTNLGDLAMLVEAFSYQEVH